MNPFAAKTLPLDRFDGFESRLANTLFEICNLGPYDALLLRDEAEGVVCVPKAAHEARTALCSTERWRRSR